MVHIVLLISNKYTIPEAPESLFIRGQEKKFPEVVIAYGHTIKFKLQITDSRVMSGSLLVQQAGRARRSMCQGCYG